MNTLHVYICKVSHLLSLTLKTILAKKQLWFLLIKTAEARLGADVF